MSQSSTPYDDVFRTILNDCRGLIPPLLNEIFSESYTGTEAIYFGKNEHLMNRQRGEGEKRITDSSFTVDSVLIIRYHLECQSSGDASIDRRMFEYDSQIALEDSEEKEDGLYLPFPKSAVLFLRRTAHTTEKMQIYIEQNGREFCMEIPIVNIIDYTMEELFRKKLLILLPFHLFRYESLFPKMEEDERERQALRDAFCHMRRQLEELNQQGSITEYVCRTILDLSRKVADNLCIKYEKVREEVLEVLGGEILEYEAKTILNQGIEEGWTKGRTEAYVDLVRDGLLSLQEAAARIPMEEAELERLLNLEKKGQCEDKEG